MLVFPKNARQSSVKAPASELKMPSFAVILTASLVLPDIEETMLAESMNILWIPLILTIKGLLYDQSNYRHCECHPDLPRTL